MPFVSTSGYKTELENTAEGTQDSTDSPAQGEVKEFTVTGDDFSFSIKTMQVNMGDTVRIHFSNPDSMPHDLRIDELSAATKVLSTGQSETIEFVANKKGAFEYYCSVGSHRSRGMVGTLTVN